jgi:hypothetical protein
MKVARTVLTGGMGKRACIDRALCLPTGASGHPGAGASMYPVISPGRLSGVPHGAGHARRAVEAPRASPGPRATAPATLEALARAALCVGGAVLPTAAHREGATPRPLRLGSDCRVDAGPAQVDDPYQLCRAPHPGVSPACGRDRAAGQHPRHTRNRLTPAVGAVPDRSQLHVASRQRARATARCDPGDGGRETVAAADARDGCWPDGSGVEPARGAHVSWAPVAAATGRGRTWRSLCAATAAGQLHLQTITRGGVQRCPLTRRLAERIILRMQTSLDKTPRITRTVAVHDHHGNATTAYRYAYLPPGIGTALDTNHCCATHRHGPRASESSGQRTVDTRSPHATPEAGGAAAHDNRLSSLGVG